MRKKQRLPSEPRQICITDYKIIIALLLPHCYIENFFLCALAETALPEIPDKVSALG
jgi:hypothetical protein